MQARLGGTFLSSQPIRRCASELLAGSRLRAGFRRVPVHLETIRKVRPLPSMSSESESERCCVVAVIATIPGRKDLLLKRAVPSVLSQTRKVDKLVIVLDTEDRSESGVANLKSLLHQVNGADSDVIDSNVEVIFNRRTCGMSGTGAWNTGIQEGFKVTAGERCWIAILDDDDEWLPDHVEACLEAAAAKRKESASLGLEVDCQWVVSGLIRKRQGKPDREEDFPDRMPTVEAFLVENPGVQGSNLFVRCAALMQAGCFDEALASTTDRDLCIRLCDTIGDAEWTFASTGRHTVLHYADSDRERVSLPGSDAKKQGLRHFYYKHGPRMTEKQRDAFRERSWRLFDCPMTATGSACSADSGWEESIPKGIGQESCSMRTWSGEPIGLHPSTIEAIRQGPLRSAVGFTSSCQDEIKDDTCVLFGMITSSHRRVSGLLADIASGFPKAFVVLFSNAEDSGALAMSLENELITKALDGSVFGQHNASDVINELFPSASFPLPIAQSRTVLQVCMFGLSQQREFHPGERLHFEALVVLDDDKRLPSSWRLKEIVAEYGAAGSGDDEGSSRLDTESENDARASVHQSSILLGRDIKAAPNTVVMSMRTQLVDLYYNILSLNVGSPQALHLPLPECFAEKHDQYYDLSSSRFDLLEMPIYGPASRFADLAVCFEHVLRGEPLARDAVPSVKDENSTQRGGCMVLVRKDFQLLLTEQVIPIIHSAPHSERSTNLNGTGSEKERQTNYLHCRRSDSVWCQHHMRSGKGTGISIAKSCLAVIHNNVGDGIAGPERMRQLVVAEMGGAVLCRERHLRSAALEERILALRFSIARIRGLLFALRKLAAASRVETWSEGCHGLSPDQLLSSIKPFEDIMEPAAWEREVFTVLEREKRSLLDWQPEPRRFDSDSPVNIVEVCKHSRILSVWQAKQELVSLPGIQVDDLALIGTGDEGIVFRHDGDCFKVFHAPNCNLSTMFHEQHSRGQATLYSRLQQLHPRLEIVTPRILRMEHYVGKPYRGGFGKELRMLMKNLRHLGLCMTNFKPDNVVVTVCEHENGDRDTVELQLVDVGSSWVFYSPAQFESMCIRAFLSFRYGKWAATLDGKNELRQLMSRTLKESRIPELSGFTLADFEDQSQSQVPIDDVGHLLMVRVNGRGPGVLFKASEVVAEDRLGEVQLDLQRVLVPQPILTSESAAKEETAEEKMDSEANTSKATLMIKTCPQEASIIYASVSQIVRQLEKVASFREVLLVVDHTKINHFLRQYTEGPADEKSFDRELERIEAAGLVHQVVHFRSGCSELNLAYLALGEAGAKNRSTHSFTGEQFASTFFGFQNVTTPLVLQMDSDVFLNIADADKNAFFSEIENGIAPDDLVVKAWSIFEHDPTVVAYTPLPIFSESRAQKLLDDLDQSLTSCRFEVRFSFLHLRRLRDHQVFPLQILQEDQPPEFFSDPTSISPLNKGWYRIFDKNLENKELRSVRGKYAGASFFVHPPNRQKEDVDHYLLLMDRLTTTDPSANSDWESYSAQRWHKQDKQVDLQDDGVDWFGERFEPIIFVICGRSVAIGRSLRCLKSLKAQQGVDSCGIVVIDDASDDHVSHEYLVEQSRVLFSRQQLTMISTRRRRGSLRNTFHCIRRVCKNPQSIIVTLDLDDMLLTQPDGSPSVVEYLQNLYEDGNTWVAVGGMVRHNKGKSASRYPLELGSPRTARSAGNVWKHLRSFRKWLFDSIEDSHFLLRSADSEWSEEKWFEEGADWAFMIPIVEQAGPDRVHDIDEDQKSLYFYEEFDHDGHKRSTKHAQVCCVSQRLHGIPPYATRTHTPTSAQALHARAQGLEGKDEDEDKDEAQAQAEMDFEEKGGKDDSEEVKKMTREVGGGEDTGLEGEMPEVASSATPYLLSRNVGEDGADSSLEFLVQAATTRLPIPQGDDFDYMVFPQTKNRDEGQISCLLKGCTCGPRDKRLTECRCFSGQEDVPVRIHSECFTGDVLGSKKCDCGEQKEKFIDLMARSDKPSVLVYIHGHEGRGVGLHSKILSYQQMDSDQELNHIESLKTASISTQSRQIQDLGSTSDCRKYESAVKVLHKKLQLDSVVLFTNNKEKVEAMEKGGFGGKLRVQKMPSSPNCHNAKYLHEKATDLGHDGLLGTDEIDSFVENSTEEHLKTPSRQRGPKSTSEDKMLLPKIDPEERSMCLQPDALSQFLKHVRLESLPESIDHQNIGSQLNALNQILRAVFKLIPFQNLTFRQRCAASVDDPSESLSRFHHYVVSEMCSGRGGLCFVRNTFLFLVLRELGYSNVRAVPAFTERYCTQRPLGVEPDHACLLAELCDGQTYWIDAGNGYPYLEAAQLPEPSYDSPDAHVSSLIVPRLQHPFMNARLCAILSSPGKPDGASTPTLSGAKSEHQFQPRSNPESTASPAVRYQVQHQKRFDRATGREITCEWRTNYTFCDISKGFCTGLSLFKSLFRAHKNNTVGSPFLDSVRFNLWSESGCAVLRNDEAFEIEDWKKVKIEQLASLAAIQHWVDRFWTGSNVSVEKSCQLPAAVFSQNKDRIATPKMEYVLERKRVLVTGGAGFIGSHTALALLRRGDNVIILDKLNDDLERFRKEDNLDWLKSQYSQPRLQIYHGDLCDPSFVAKVFDATKPQRVVHLAARPGVLPSIKDPVGYIVSNEVSTTCLLEECRQFGRGIEHVVIASSSSVYGVSEKREWFEDDNTTRPASPYAATKKSCEMMAGVFHDVYKLNCTLLRFFTVYGPRGRPDMAPFKFIDRISRGAVVGQNGDGSSERDYTYITDIVDGILRSLDRPPAQGFQVYNLGNGNPIALTHFISTIEKLLGRKADVRVEGLKAGDVPRTCANIARARKEIGYNPRVGLEQGLQAMIDWHRTLGPRQTSSWSVSMWKTVGCVVLCVWLCWAASSFQ